MDDTKGRRAYSASEIEAELAKRRMCIAEDAVTLEAFEPESDDDRAWYKGMFARLENACALVAIVEQLRDDNAEYRGMSGAPDEAFSREHEQAVARLRGEKLILEKVSEVVDSAFISVRTERQRTHE